MPVRRRSWQRWGSAVVSGMGYVHPHHHHNRGAVVSAAQPRRRRYHRSHHRTANHQHSVNITADTASLGKTNTQATTASMKQEVSVCLRSMSPSRQPTSTARPATHPQLPLRVVLPPEKVAENKSARLLTMDQNCNKKTNDSETTDDNNKTLNVEEFECGVSVAGSDKQEWSFTLYDFDGKGKITKEDLGSLLRSLYDAVGSSINLPKSGTKTLKLRLTVSPDNSKVTGSPGVTAGSTPAGSAHPARHPKDKNFIKETNNKTKESKLNKDLDNSKLSGKDLKLDNISKAEQLNLEATSEPKVHYKEVKNNLSNPGKPQTQSQRVGTMGGGGGAVVGADGKPTPGKPQLSSTEQRHLAELVQRNMERHQQRQQQRHQHRARRDHRKYHSFNTGNNRPTGVVPPHTCEESRDRRNYYLDLAGIENGEPSRIHNTSAPADLLSPRLGKRDHGHRSRDAKLRSRSHNARRQLQVQAHKQAVAGGGEGTLNSSSVAAVVDGGDIPDVTSHQRSRSYDVPQDHCKLAAEEELAAEVTSHRTWLMERAVEEKVEMAKNISSTTTTTTTTSPATTSPQSPPPAILTSPQSASTPNSKNAHKPRPVSLPANVPDAVSPHHHRRHRNRERNRKLAMQQVAEWIEREHTWNAATGNGSGAAAAPGDKAQAHGTGGASAGGNTGGASAAAECVIVQRHEHHHVHEHHHHHHYHHYHET